MKGSNDEKKTVSIILAAALFVILNASVFAAETNQKAANEQLDIPHVYSLLPGSEEWEDMSPEQRYASCEVTEDEVCNMTCEALVETVLNYPYLINVFAYDTLEAGIKEVSEYFPGIEELSKREDAISVLQTYQPEAYETQSDISDVKSLYAITLQEYFDRWKRS